MAYQANDLLGDKGQYRIIRCIGQGAMGEIYEAEMTRLHKIVAVKVMHNNISTNKEFIHRFKREALAAAALSHPNICDVTDLDEMNDGDFYIVMEMLRGETLRERLQRVGAMAPARALLIMRQLLSALQSAHEKDIVHRDVKPDNIYLVQQNGMEDFVKLIDFGIAHWDDPAGGDKGPQTQMTRAGEVYGTPQYLSPEQACGAKVDNRADLYACGIILFEMLTGQPPFMADNVIELLHKHLSTPPPHLPENIDFHAPLDDVIQKLLQKNPDDRFASARETLAAIDEIYVHLDLTELPTHLSASLQSASLNLSSLPKAAETTNSRFDDCLHRAKSILLHLKNKKQNIIKKYIFPKLHHYNKWTIAIVSAIVLICIFILIVSIILIHRPSYPFKYDMNSFQIAYDEDFRTDDNMRLALENFAQENYPLAKEYLAMAKDQYDNRPNYWLLSLMVACEQKNSKSELVIIKNILMLTPDAVRNDYLRNAIYRLADKDKNFDNLLQMLHDLDDDDDATRSVAWMIALYPLNKRGRDDRIAKWIDCIQFYGTSDLREISDDHAPWLGELANVSAQKDDLSCQDRADMLKILYKKYHLTTSFEKDGLIPLLKTAPDCLREELSDIVPFKSRAKEKKLFHLF